MRHQVQPDRRTKCSHIDVGSPTTPLLLKIDLNCSNHLRTGPKQGWVLRDSQPVSGLSKVGKVLQTSAQSSWSNHMTLFSCILISSLWLEPTSMASYIFKSLAIMPLTSSSVSCDHQSTSSGSSKCDLCSLPSEERCLIGTLLGSVWQELSLCPRC